jgi:hypothetical protein
LSRSLITEEEIKLESSHILSAGLGWMGFNLRLFPKTFHNIGNI